MNEYLGIKFILIIFIPRTYIYTLFPAVAPTRHDLVPLNLPTETVRGKTLLFNCKEKTGANI